MKKKMFLAVVMAVLLSSTFVSSAATSTGNTFTHEINGKKYVYRIDDLNYNIGENRMNVVRTTIGWNNHPSLAFCNCCGCWFDVANDIHLEYTEAEQNAIKKEYGSYYCFTTLHTCFVEENEIHSSAGHASPANPITTEIYYKQNQIKLTYVGTAQ